ncbi:M1 family metallopeptidase [Paenibacillus silvae]|uniref:M1 family metallopeptidase n=1 Tax=Paenibacillus silvae TaxID=1325358 RepID=UPI0020043949|nr:M1 family metallopeptidase [Paenibacillus silvae]
MHVSKTKPTNTIKKVMLSTIVFTLAASPFVHTTYAAPSNWSSLIASAETTQKAFEMQQASRMRSQQAMSQDQSPIQYQIKARLDEKDMTITGNQIVTYRNTSKDTLQELVMHTYADANRSKATQTIMYTSQNEQIAKEHPEKKASDFLGGIDIVKVSQQGEKLLFDHKNQALRVQLKTPLQPGQSISFQVDYRLDIPYGMQRLSYYKDQINGAHWFPVMSVYDENTHQWNKTPYSTSFESDYYTSSDFDVEFNVPESYQVVMPGDITSQKSTEHGRKVVTARAANTREFAFFAGPNLKVERETRNGLTVEYFYSGDDPAKKAAVDKYIDYAFKVIAFYSEKYGEYPYPEFRVIETYVDGFGVEYSRLIQMPERAAELSPENDTTFVHEIAHQWFHALIGNNSETESFLDEGFAEFSTVYFLEKQGNKVGGFRSIQLDPSPIDLPIASTNEQVGEMADYVFYQKGRQAIYQLYRSVGEQKFDAFMKEYFHRFVYQNATIDGLLATIEDVLGKEQRQDMEKALIQPNYELKQEYQMSEKELAAYMHDAYQPQYEAVVNSIPNLPYEVMIRLMEKSFRGEPLTIVLGDQVSKAAAKQQEQATSQLTQMFDVFGMKYDVVRDRKELKQKLKGEIGSSNLILVGNAKSNGIVQALKKNINVRANGIGLAWKDAMNASGHSGAYVIKHPYNQNRLMLHYYWNGDHLSAKASASFMEKILESLTLSNDLYRFYELDGNGKLKTSKKVE